MEAQFEVTRKSETIGRIVFAKRGAPDRLIDYDETRAGREEFYEKFYADGPTPLDATRELQYAALWKAVEPLLPRATPLIALDVGCGRGGFVRFLQKQLGTRGQALGLEPALAQETPALRRGNWPTALDAGNLPARYHLISFLDVFEHFPEPASVVAELEKRIAPEGILLLKVPNKNALAYLWSRALSRILPQLGSALFIRLYQLRCPPPHYFYHTRESLAAAVAPRFEVIATSYMSEVPLGGMASRFWFLPKPLVPFAVLGALIYRLFAIGKWNDSVVVLAKLKRRPAA